MVALISTMACIGLEAQTVEVQVQLAPGLAAFHIVGLPDKAVGESRERVRATIAAMGLSLPPKNHREFIPRRSAQRRRTL